MGEIGPEQNSVFRQKHRKKSHPARILANTAQGFARQAAIDFQLSAETRRSGS
jgi:hypothetical protein